MRKRSLSSTPLWIITLLGIGVTALGVYVQSTGSSPGKLMSAGTLMALGGGVVGAAISIFLASGDGRDTLAAVHDALERSLGVNMRSREADLETSRRVWHCYWVTQRHGRYVWVQSTYNLVRGQTPGLAMTELTGVPPGDRAYKVELAVRGTRMLFVDAAQSGNEPPTVGIMPYFTEGYRDIHAGVVLVRTWDGVDLLSKCVWSATPLAGSHEITHDDGLLLDSVWDRTFPSNHAILPAAGSDMP